MKNRNWLISATLGEVLLVVGVLAGYLTAIAAVLRRVSRTLGQVTFGVRAIEKQTEPIGPSLREVNANLGRAAQLLGDSSSEG